MCNVPYLGKREVTVLPDSPLAISVTEELDNYGGIYIQTASDGATVTLADGTHVYLQTDYGVPILSESCTVDYTNTQRTETYGKQDTDHAMLCQPCV